MKEFNFIKNVAGKKTAETVGWWQNKCVVKFVMALKKPIYDCGGALTGTIHLHTGDILVLQNGKYAIVEKIQHKLPESSIKVYNFEAADFHTYYVGDSSIIVHNVYKPTSPLKVNDNALKKIDVYAFKKNL